jgi:CHAD domain-containing protein
MPSGKWITEITSKTATIDAARRVISLRFEALRAATSCVFRDRDDTFEDVHQLRVAARRASAALDIFEPCLGKKTFRSTLRRLRRVRRAAGEARDLDIVLMQCTDRLEHAKPEEARALDLVCGCAIAERIPAQVRLEEACEGYPFKLERWMCDTIGALHSPPRGVARMRSLGREYLGGLCERIGAAIGAPAPGYEELHALRVLAKKLRYAMEVFAGCFAAPFREELYPCVTELQEILGSVSDAHIGLARMEELSRGVDRLLPSRSDRWKEPLKFLAEDMQRSRAQGREQFEAWRVRVGPTGFEALLQGLLADVPAGTSTRPIPPRRAS